MSNNTSNLPLRRLRLFFDRKDLRGFIESGCHWRNIFGANALNTNPPTLGLDFTRAAENRAVMTYGLGVGQDHGDGENVQEATLVLGQDLGKLGLGGVVWNCGEDLAAFLGRHGHLVSGKRVLDLGTGTGIAGLAAAQCGAKEVILTDRPALEPLVRSNVERNSGFSSSHVRFEPLEWGAEVRSRDTLTSSDEPFDIVLASDCLYDPVTFPAFKKTLRAVCDLRTLCLMAYKRRLDSREKTFFEQLEVDFDLQVMQSHQHQPRLPSSGVTPRATTDGHLQVMQSHQHQPRLPSSGVTPRATTDGHYATFREVYLILGALRGCHQGSAASR